MLFGQPQNIFIVHKQTIDMTDVCFSHCEQIQPWISSLAFFYKIYKTKYKDYNVRFTYPQYLEWLFINFFTSKLASVRKTHAISFDAHIIIIII